MIDEHWILIVRLIALMLSLSRWKISFAARFCGDGFSEISNLPLDLRIQLYCYRNNSRFILAKIEIYRKILFSHLFYNIYDIFVSFEFAYYNYPILYVIVIFSLYCNNSFVTSLTLIIFQPTNFLKKKKKNNIPWVPLQIRIITSHESGKLQRNYIYTPSCTRYFTKIHGCVENREDRTPMTMTRRIHSVQKKCIRVPTGLCITQPYRGLRARAILIARARLT